MIRLIDNLTDFIFPRRCPVCHDIVAKKGKLICDECKDVFVRVKDPFCMKCGKQLSDIDRVYCTFCEKSNIQFIEGRAVFLYDDNMRKSIYRFKYGGRMEYAKYYAYEIYNKYKEKIRLWNPTVIIPIPLHRSKLKKRGYNQAFLIAKELSVLTKIPVDNKILTRVKKTEKQKNLGVSGRENNVKNAFKMVPNGVQYLSAMLIDDIYTTGATICNASDALIAGGIENIYYISLSIGRDV